MVDHLGHVQNLLPQPGIEPKAATISDTSSREDAYGTLCTKFERNSVTHNKFVNGLPNHYAVRFSLRSGEGCVVAFSFEQVGVSK